MRLPGYQAPVMKASRCGNERQVDLAGRKRVVQKGIKRYFSLRMIQSSSLVIVVFFQCEVILCFF